MELISSITEFNDLHEYMGDDQLDKALAIVVKLLMNPDVPSAKAPYLIITTYLLHIPINPSVSVGKFTRWLPLNPLT